jgi:hypothetical protein
MFASRQYQNEFLQGKYEDASAKLLVQTRFWGFNWSLCVTFWANEERLMPVEQSCVLFTREKFCDHADDGLVKLSQQCLLNGLIVDVLQGRRVH